MADTFQNRFARLCRIATLATGVFLLAATLPAAGSSAAQSDGMGVDSAIIFVMDVSASMDRDEIGISREAHAAAMTSEDVLSAIVGSYFHRIAVAYVEFASAARPRVGWTIIDGPASAAEFAQQIRALPPGNSDLGGGGTSVSAGLAVALGMIDGLPYQADRIVVDILGDGVGFERANLIPEIRDSILRRYAVINALPLMVDPSDRTVDEWYRTHIQGGPGSFTVPARSLEDLPRILRSKIAVEGF